MDGVHVGDEQGIGRNLHGHGFSIAQIAHVGLLDPKRTVPVTVLRHVGSLPRRQQALSIFPAKAFPGQPVGAGNNVKRSVLRGNVVNIEPRLDARMEGVGMEVLLRVVTGRCAGMVDDVFEVKKGNPVFRRGIAQQPEQLPVATECRTFGQAGKNFLRQVQPLSQRAAFCFLADFALVSMDFVFQSDECFFGQEVFQFQITVSAKESSLLRVGERCQEKEPERKQQVRDEHAGDMQAEAVEPGIADQRIFLERLFPGEQFDEMPGQFQ